MKRRFTRRDFLEMSAKGVGAAVVSYGLMGCSDSNSSSDDAVKAEFLHGVASGDPSHDAINLWTRVTPEVEGELTVAWELATDTDFTNLVTNGETTTSAERDYTIKVDATGLDAGTEYFYRFKQGEAVSEMGRALTLPQGAIDQVKLAVLSCANFPAGHFNVYALAAQPEGLDAVIHLGDYIYEYARGEYASEHAADMGREVLPAGELFTLGDYRTRYAQYRTDPSLAGLHAKEPFITVWDDHEIANDTWKDGAENHNEEEGAFDARKQGALQA